MYFAIGIGLVNFLKCVLCAYKNLPNLKAFCTLKIHEQKMFAFPNENYI